MVHSSSRDRSYSLTAGYCSTDVSAYVYSQAALLVALSTVTAFMNVESTAGEFSNKVHVL